MVLQSAPAADFHPISSVTTSTTADLWPVSNLIQGPGNGYAAGGEHEQLGSGASHRWVTAAPGGFPSDYIEETGKPVLIFDLGEDRPLSEISVWGYTTTNANGVSRFSLRFATAAEGEQQLSASISYNPFFDSVIDDTPRQSFAFSEVVIARYVEFTCEDNFHANGGSGPPGGGDRVGLGEVAFADAVPNPHPIIVVQAALDFGNVVSDPGAVTLPLSISNAGSDLPLELTSTTILANATGSEHFSVSGIPDFIAAGEVRDFVVTFDSGGVEGCFNAQLELGSNDPAQPLTSVLLKAGINCVSPEPVKPMFSVEGGTFVDDFALELSTPTPGAQILYTTDGSLPSIANGMVYDGSIPITETVQIRAATFSGDQPPAIATESFVRLAPDLAGYESGLPIVIIENFGQGSVPNKGWSTGSQTGGGLIQPERQSAYLRIIATDPMTGIASISASADTDSRIGIRVRGAFSSTWTPKPYSLETWKQNGDDDRRVSPLGLPKESDWILYYPHPNYDRSMLNNTFIWALSRETGRYGTRFRFVDVFVNESACSVTGSASSTQHNRIRAFDLTDAIFLSSPENLYSTKPSNFSLSVLMVRSVIMKDSRKNCSSLIAVFTSSKLLSSRLFIYCLPHNIIPDFPALAHISARTADILAKLLVFPDPRPPYAALTNALPLKTSSSLGGSATLTLDTWHQFYDGNFYIAVYLLSNLSR